MLILVARFETCIKGNINQRFTWNAWTGRMRVSAATGQCLQLNGDEFMATGTTATFAPCVSTTNNYQVWVGLGGYLKSGSSSQYGDGKVLSAPSNGLAGNVITIDIPYTGQASAKTSYYKYNSALMRRQNTLLSPFSLKTISTSVDSYPKLFIGF